MAKWQNVRLGDVCTIERGGSPRPIEDYITDDENGINWIKIGDTDDSKYITKTEQKIRIEGTKKSRFVKTGDFLLSNSMSFGRPYILKIDGCIHDGWLVIRDENSTFNKDYLYYYLSSPIMYNHFKSLAVGGVVNNLNSKMVRDVSVPLPPLETQKQIAANLDKVTRTIDICNAILEKLDLLVKARFVEMFGYPFGTEKWQIKQLEALSKSLVDGSNINPTFYQSEGEVLFLRIQNVWRNEFRLDDSVYITQEINQNRYYDTSLKNGDLLITKIGRYYTKDSSLGRVSVYRGEDDCANYSNNIMRVRLKPTMNSEFINVLLNLDDYQSFIKRTSKGGTDKRALSKSLIGSYPIIVPPIELQNQFAAFVEQTDKSKSAVKQVLEKAETLKKALMQEYFG